MSSPYNTRSTRSASASSLTASPNTDSTVTTTTTQRRHFCIVLTNNPRMIQSARRMLQNVNDSTEQGRQEESQSQPQPLPQVQMQYLQVPGRIRSRRRSVHGRHVEQQVPMSAQIGTTSMIASNMRAYEKEIEQDFRAQVQPILELYLQKTRRSHPINSVLDMSHHIQV